MTKHTDTLGLRQHTFRVTFRAPFGVWQGGAVRDDRVTAYTLKKEREGYMFLDLAHDDSCTRCLTDARALSV